MNKNLVTIGIFATLILAAFGYIIFDFLKPEEELVDKSNLPVITVVDVEVTTRTAGMGNSPTIEIKDEAEAREIIEEFAGEHGLTIDEYPYYLISKLLRNPEMKDFILNYPLHINDEVDNSEIDISSELANARNGIPQFYQWDLRWGYVNYGSDVMGFTGCGPTCLSMVASALLNDTSLTPLKVAKFSMENGYYDYANNTGTLWSLMTDGAEELGLVVNEVPGEEDLLIASLEEGHPVICIMGPGDFTSEGHFIVLTGYSDGYVTVNDPNSIERSSCTWRIETILEQTNGMWEYSI